MVIQNRVGTRVCHVTESEGTWEVELFINGRLCYSEDFNCLDSAKSSANGLVKQ